MHDNDPDGLRCSAANAYIDLSRSSDYIGLVGLNNTDGNRGGTYNFQTAKKWQDPPINTAVVRDRQTLRTAIDSNSNHCAPGGNTPTYDALNQALGMLTDATTKHPGLSGSVVLLTDGIPAPDTNDQIKDIDTTLVPEFKKHNWPIDTIALGNDGPVQGMGDLTFHKFLTNISDATSGDAYDDGHGDVEGISPLNIAPFFLNIFSKRVGRTANKDIPPTPITGQERHNFTVTELASSLDVVIIKEQPATQATLVTPGGASITDTSGGALVSQDPHYVIYSIDHPTAGQWEVDVNGSARFSLYSLTTSHLAVHVNNVAPANLQITSQNQKVFPLNQPLAVTASLTNDNIPVTVKGYQLQGTISYGGNSGQYSQTFPLDDKATPGTFVGNVNVPDTAPAGTYDIQITASTASTTNPITSSSYAVRLELFPLPRFIGQKTQQPTTDPVDVAVVQWPPALQFLYNLPIFSFLSSWPLQGHSASPLADSDGVLQWRGQLYKDASIKAEAFAGNSKVPINVNVTQDGQGHFHAQFQPPQSGDYRIVFQTSGSYKDSHGEFGPTALPMHVDVEPASGGQLIQAWMITFIILAILAFFFFLFKFYLTPAPFGEWVRTQGGERIDGRKFSRGHRGLIQWFFSRNILFSRQVGMPRGLQFRFRWGGGIEVRSAGAGSDDWQASDGSRLRDQFQRMRELLFQPRGSDDQDMEARSQYTISAQSKPTFQYGSNTSDDDYGYDYGYSTQSNNRSRSRRSRSARSLSSYDNPLFAPKPRKKQGKRGTDLYDDQDYA
jgi:hypothetical protein